MLAEIPRFVGRDQELAQIERMIGQANTLQVCLIHGPGGIGKTGLLEEIYARRTVYQQALGRQMKTTELMDLKSTALLMPLNLEYAIGSHLSDQHFREFNALRDDYTNMQLAGVSPVTQKLQLQAGYDKFIEEYNALSREFRCLLLIDTVDSHVLDQEVFGHFVEDMVPSLHNTVVVLAGKECARFLPRLQSALGDVVHLIELRGLDADETAAFFDETTIGRDVDRDLRAKIRFLTDGKPILLGLTLMWLGRDMLIPRLQELSLSQVQELPPADLDELRKDFEASLVKQLLTLDEETHQAITEMAHLKRRFNAEILAFLCGTSVAEATVLIERLAELPFVKQQPRGIHLLHDEMQELVDAYVWSFLDPMGTQRQELSLDAVKFYDGRLAVIQDELDRLAIESEQAQLADDSRKALSVMRKRSNLEREKWDLAGERLFYTLSANPELGAERFIEEFAEPSRGFLLDYANSLMREMQPFLPALRGEIKFKAAYQMAIYLRSAGQASSALTRLDDLKTELADGGESEALILQAIAACDRDLGYPEDGLSKLKRALELCERNDLRELTPWIENSMGLLLRSMGRFEEAVEYYHSCVEHAKEIGKTSLTASVMSNIGYALSMFGDHEGAIAHGKASLRIRETLGDDPRGVAMSHSVLGSIYRDQGEFELAYLHYEKALGLFESTDDRAWISTVKAERGRAEIIHYEELRYGEQLSLEASAEKLQELLRRSGDDLSESIRLGRIYNPKEVGLALRELGHVYWELGDLDRAEELWRESLDLALVSRDTRYILENLVGIAELDYDRGLYGKIPDHYEALRPYDNERNRRDHVLLWGRIIKLLGDAAFAQEEYDKALQYYGESYPLLAQHGGWGKYRFSIQLDALGDRIDSLSSKQAIQWCEVLRAQWSEVEISPQHRNRLELFLMMHEFTVESRAQAQTGQ